MSTRMEHQRAIAKVSFRHVWDCTWERSSAIDM